ncbi:apoptosis regulator R11-like [Liolophura sinensis]|uniref:apoptosis regulator R11-like n=1 Tax=Liolophura sinensis TaxID=3198878 RepID=UPI0031594A4A
MPLTNNLLAAYMGMPGSQSSKTVQFGKKYMDVPVDQQAIVIADYIHKRQVLGEKEPPPDQVCETMAYLVEEFLRGNSKSISAITDVLKDTNQKGKSHEQVITRIFDSMFSDGIVNWGRIGAAYAFGVKYCLKKSTDINGNRQGLPDERILRCVGKYVGEKLGTWIEKQGGWDSVVGLFPNQEAVLKRFRSLGYLCLTVGLGSLLNALSS